MDASELQEIYRRQASWFAGERSRLLRKANIAAKRCVLDLGCGTGETLPELRRRARGEVYGVDSDAAALAQAGAGDPLLVTADARDLPFPDGRFDLVFTQMFFLWVDDIPGVLAEIRRVLSTGGHLILAAEPDYGGAIEYPDRPGGLDAFAQQLSDEGADVRVGRKLGGWLSAAGFEVQCGVHPVRPLEAAESPAQDFVFVPYFHFFCRRGG